MRGARLVREAYDGLARVVADCDEDRSWAPPACRGRAGRDLTFPCLAHAQRALLAVHAPTSPPPDRDAVTYWLDWAPDPVGTANGRRYVRVAASMFSDWQQLRDLYVATATAVSEALANFPPDRRVRTQGHVLTVEDLACTLCVEATIHHLDLVGNLSDPGPSGSGLAEVRRVLDALVAAPLEVTWSDERYALVATGRAEPTADEARALGGLADRFPLFS